jgi:meiotically up-regulated gene 157 (Mug157) protein
MRVALGRLNPSIFLSGPHVDTVHPWPMSLISAIYGSDDEEEIENLLYTIVNVSGLFWSRGL